MQSIALLKLVIPEYVSGEKYQHNVLSSSHDPLVDRIGPSQD